MTWLQLRRLMRQAGWIRVERIDRPPARDEDGAPWDDGSWEFIWKRYGPDPEDGAEEITAYWNIAHEEFDGQLSYYPYGADHDWNHQVSVGVPMVEDLGLNWLCGLMKVAHIL